ncbi:O6-methylguanine-DNA methyltransferase [Ameyamaea chiangmaiensis NBRC 103196]|uniref:Methylated-DNA--protein-cysteine methyltransferase n=1 Tax=Ameyamaea chiangmaiensis TaxID=442969 RepID=A0A850PIP2_9PROT|nr:methylated-DNA--[protein]-cysteine S-methyltransferase [Ameyamaea chiangmaiensis]MBS4074915.1 methylated-DNA--[protein]-cysteine S-methyltransferase [Ameyamaea chiangmaiensis]NVN41121.1 methylated-DNA--[protein]-cysteine S-methyltransferase [Ameyamaea chiangmaiensis]GBQ63196.1 O6-methylguanine-DNA methyltransferase [Ameyamaea chiangmaiensis NBRC 103196]
MPQISLHSPLGSLTLTEEDGAIVALDWGRGRDQEETPLLRAAADWLDRYFDGEAEPFDLPLRPFGSPYRQQVWTALRSIPPGDVQTYGAVARTAGGSARSVGGAVGANPIPIIIPCHRVVAADGIGGYSGEGGVEHKQFLLHLERLSKMPVEAG